MKKLIILIASVIMVIGCQKDVLKTTYTINVNIGYQAAAELQNIAYKADVTINEYCKGEIVTTQFINGIMEGKDYVIEANPKSEYLTIKYDVETGGEQASFWIGKIYDIEKGKNIDVRINYSTIVIQKEPKR